MLHGAVVLSPHARARVRAIDTSKARALPGVEAVATAEDVPGERWYGLIYDDWPGFVAVGEEVRCVGDVLAAVAAVDEATARAAAALVEVDYELLEPVLDPEAALAEGAPQVNPKHPNELSCTAGAARRRRRGAGRERPRGQRHLDDAADRAPLPRARGGAGRAAARRAAAPLHPGAGGLRRPPPGGAVPRRAGGAGPRRAGAQRRRLRRQGGHVDPGADGAAGADDRPAGEADPRSRGVDPAAPQAPPDHDGLHGGLRRRGPTDRGPGADDRRHRRLRLGGLQGARARRRPRLRPLQGGQRRRRVARRLHQQPALRGDARLRRQPGPLRHGGGAGSAGREGRPRRLGDPLAQRPGGGRHLLHRPGAREVGGAQADAPGGQGLLLRGAARGPGGGHRLRHQEHRHRQRRRGVRQGPPGGRGGRHGLALQRLHRDGAGPADHPGPVRGRGHRAAAGGLRAQGRLDLRARLRPDHRLARHPARRPGGAVAAAEKLKPDLDGGKTLADLGGPGLRGRGADRRHHRAGPGDRQDQDPHRLRLRHPGLHPRRGRARSSASSPPTTSAGRSTRRCARARSRARSTWAWATR